MTCIFLALTFIFGAIGYLGFKKDTDAAEVIGIISIVLSMMSFIFFIIFACGGIK
jgi:hypothetical protein